MSKKTHHDNKLRTQLKKKKTLNKQIVYFFTHAITQINKHRSKNMTTAITKMHLYVQSWITNMMI